MSTPKVHRPSGPNGGDELIVEDGGLITVKSGGGIDVESGGALKLAGTAIVPSAAELNTQIRVAAVEISSAELLALYTTPKALVAAPGAGKVLEFVSLLLAYDYATTAYTIGTAGNMQVNYTDGSGQAASTTRAATGFLDQTSDKLSLLDKLEATQVPVVNAALVLIVATASPSLGNSPIHAKVAYRVHSTGL